MALSAFGVDHGEISKGIPGMGLVSSLGAKAGGALTSGGTRLRARGANTMKVGRELQAAAQPKGFGNKTRPMTNREKKADNYGRGMRLGGLSNVKAGGAMRGLGQKMTAHPGAAGGAILGTGAAGGGALAFGGQKKYG